MADVCPAGNVTTTTGIEWDDVVVFTKSVVASDMFFVLTAITLYFCCVLLSKPFILRPPKHTPFADGRENRRSAENNYSKIRRRSFSCPAVLTWEHKDPSEYTNDDLEEIFNHEKEENPFQEPADEYTFGGYMPVNIGDTLPATRKYTVVRKLGYGHYSTVWLCHNNQHKKYEAVKLIKSGEQYTAAADDEIRMLRTTAIRNPSHPGYNFILQMLDSFLMVSENGSHHCLTFEFMGPSLLSLIIQSGFRGIQEDAVRSIIKQVLQGLVYLHEECRIIHTDLKPENILVCVKENQAVRMAKTVQRFKELNVPMPASYISSQAYEEQFGELDNQNQKVARRNSVPRSKLPDDSEMEKTRFCRFRNSKDKGPLMVDPKIHIKIADLGNGCYENLQHSSQIQTLQYRALEVILRSGYSFPADIWSVGCTTFELATGEYLFHPKQYNNVSMEEDHLGLIWELLDGIPSYIARKGRKSRLYFDNSGKLRHIGPEKLRIWKLEDVLVEKYKWKRVQAIPFAAFVQAMIEPDPELRATAATALEHSWLLEGSD